MWFLPTHKRPEKLLRFVRSLSGSDMDEDVTVIVWNCDPKLNAYAQTFAALPKRWNVWIQEERTCGAKLQNAFRSFPGEGFYGFLSDDVTLQTTGMLGELRRDALAGFFAWPNDGLHGPRLATHPCAPGDFIRTLGFWAHPQFPHNGLDTILYFVAEAIGIGKYRGDLHIDNHHPLAVVAPQNGWKHEEWDETYADAAEMNNKAIGDMYDFQERFLPGIVDRMRKEYRGQRQDNARAA